MMDLQLHLHCNPRLLSLLALLFLLSLSGPLLVIGQPTIGTTYYVKPTEDTSCPGDPDKCHTLMEYAQNATQYFSCGTACIYVSVLFLPGVHHLNQTLFKSDAYTLQFDMKAAPTVTNGSNVTILCNNGSLHFKGFSTPRHLTVIIEDLIFSRCGNPCPSQTCWDDLSTCTYSDKESDSVTGSMNFEYILNLRIAGVTIEKGWPILLRNVVGYSEIANLTVRHPPYAFLSQNRVYWAVSFFREAYTMFTSPAHLQVEDSLFYDYPGAICVNTQQFSQQTGVQFVNITFVGNVIPLTSPSVVALFDVTNIDFVDCHFISNVGTPISVKSSRLNVSGSISFVNNTGRQGGAMAFYQSSTMIINNHTRILFQNNSAVVGGAIFVDHGYDLLYGDIFKTPCFFTCDCYSESAANHSNITLRFVNNTAQLGGNAMYGASIDTCVFLNAASSRYPNQVIYFISHFEPSEDLSLITSPPSRVCLCDEDGKPDCASSIQSIYAPPQYHYPGETFTISAVLVGDEFGTASGSVYAQFLLLNRNRTIPQFGALQETQRVGYKSCTDLQYTVLSENRSEIIVLTADEATVNNFGDVSYVNDTIDDFITEGKVSAQLLTFWVYLNITLLPCPLGFTLASPPGECVCSRQMKQNDITCNITDQTLHRSGTTWINASSANDGVIVAMYCPFYYCISEEVAVNLSNPDSQCQFNHSGTLCGGCQPGLSLALGSSQCRHCSNTYLLLLIPFAIAYIALVFFIKLLNLTVSKGTINGLIFYANIVGAIPTIFFPAGASNPLTVFIAWLNLDLGIETCFFDGLNAYLKLWLELVFVLANIGVIFILVRYSELARKVLGSNSLDVLATLFLLSYAKLLRAIITALSFSILDMPDGTIVTVWSLDGNIRYLSGIHIPLFVVAVILLLLWLPFTAILLFWQLLTKISHFRVVRWIVIKQKPFFDNYFGPLKGEHRYWFGALLLIRVFLLSVFAVIVVVPTDATRVDLFAITVVTVALLAYVMIVLPCIPQQKEPRRPRVAADLSLAKKVQERLSTFTGSCYNSWSLSLLENSFFLNLGVLSAATLYVNSIGGNQAAVAYTSVSIVFAEFVGIVCFHGYGLLRKWRIGCRKRGERQLQNINDHEYERYTDVHVPAPNHPLQKENQNFSDYREPLLEYAND